MDMPTLASAPGRCHGYGYREFPPTQARIGEPCHSRIARSTKIVCMLGGVARTSTYALNNVTLPHALRIADKGWRAALLADPHLKGGLNVRNGKVTYRAVADDLGYAYAAADAALAA